MLERRGFVVGALALWLLVLLLTHYGARSPYTYTAQAVDGLDVTRVANPDALTVLPVTRWFYDGAEPAWGSAHNIWLPSHSFAAAVVTSFVRPYLVANAIVNLAFLVLLTVVVVRASERFGVSRLAVLLGLATVYLLPAIAGYIGQPMQYIVGPVISALVIVAAVCLPEDDLRNPWISGALTAVLTLNYDWYVFGIALAAYVLVFVRFRRRVDALIYVALPLFTLVGWRTFVNAIAGGGASIAVQNAFFASVLAGYGEMRQVTLPYSLTHIGAAIGVVEILALIYWPLVIACVVALWMARPRVTSRPAMLLLLLFVFYALEQLFTAGFDPENNPRRAIPVVVAFAFAYCWAIDRLPRWRMAFIALLVVTALIAYTDTLFHKPAAALLYQGDAVRAEPKLVLRETIQATEIRIAPVEAKQQPLLTSFARASFGTMSIAFVFAQLVCAAAFVVLFWCLARAGLLPRQSVMVSVALIVLSWIVRFF